MRQQDKMNFSGTAAEYSAIAWGKEFYKTTRWKTCRKNVFKVYKPVCHKCGASKHDTVLHVDHIKPRSKHPSLAFDLNNLQILCASCNGAKGDHVSIDYRSEADKLLMEKFCTKKRKTNRTLVEHKRAIKKRENALERCKRLFLKVKARYPHEMDHKLNDLYARLGCSYDPTVVEEAWQEAKDQIIYPPEYNSTYKASSYSDKTNKPNVKIRYKQRKRYSGTV